jgi:hypothetical protein
MPNNNQTEGDRAQSTVTGRAATSEEVAFRNGYVNGRSTERDRAIRYEQQRANAQANNGVATGLTISLLLVAVAGLFGAIAYSLTGPSNPTETTVETAPEPEPVENTTIIDRTIERTQEVVPAPPEVNLPDVNITLPEGADPQPANAESDPNAPAPEAADSSAEVSPDTAQ